MKTVLPLCAAVALSGCATTPALDSQAAVGNGDDCAVVAAILREHFGFGPSQQSEPLVFVEGLSEKTCSWAQHGLASPPFYDPETALWAPRYVVHISQPRYDGAGALVETGRRMGNRSTSWQCRVHSGFAGWTVGECQLLGES